MELQKINFNLLAAFKRTGGAQTHLDFCCVTVLNIFFIVSIVFYIAYSYQFCVVLLFLRTHVSARILNLNSSSVSK